MKNIGKNKLAILTLITVFALSVLSLCFAVSIKADNGRGAIEEFISREYQIGDKAVFPDGNGQRVVYSPSGKSYGANELKLDESGNWKLTFTSSAGTDTYGFFVNVPLFISDGERSRVDYGKASDYTKYAAGGQSGAIAKIYSGEKLTYSAPIDLNGKTKNDTLLAFSVLPEIAGTEDAINLFFTLTDYRNPNNEIKVKIKRVPWDGEWYKHAVYIMAGATGQEGQGLEKQTSGNLINYEGVNYIKHVGFDGTWGTCATFSMTGVMGEAQIGTQILKFSMDYGQKRLYVGNQLIIDFDEPQFQDVLWEGFTDGKCLFSVYAEGYNNAAFNILISNVAGNSAFADKHFANIVKPVIEVTDYDYGNVKALALDKPFKISAARAYDVRGRELKVSAGVYTAYGTGNQTNIGLTDGAFTPKQPRDYFIVYSCIDGWGNRAEEVYKIKAIASADKISLLSLPPSATCTVGRDYVVAAAVPDNFTGNYAVKVSAELDGKTVDIGEYAYGDNADGFIFRPMETGDWKIVYLLSDLYDADVREEYALTVTSGDAVFYEDAPVPEYVIKGATYTLPELYGYDFTGGSGALKAAALYITEDGVTDGKQPAASQTHKVTATADTLYFTYVLGGAKKEYRAKVIDVGYKTAGHRAEKYFYGYDGVALEDNGFNYDVAKNGNEYSLDYVNGVQAYKFIFGFAVPSNAGYSKLNIYLSDADKTDNAIKVSYFDNGGTAYYSVNDGYSYSLGGEYKSARTLYYNAVGGKIGFAEHTVSVTENLAGEAFAGFAKGRVNIKITFENVNGAAPFFVSRLNNQSFYNYNRFSDVDEAPEIYQDEILGIRRAGDTVTLLPIYVADVYAVKTVVALEVFAPDGEYVTATDGTVLDGSEDAYKIYTVKLDSYGSYIVKYVVDDELGQFNDYLEYNVNIADVDSPTVEIGAHAVKASVGDKISFATVTATDDVTTDCAVEIYLERPDGTLVPVENGKTYEYGQKGVYTVWYYVYDAAGNATVDGYSVYVI